MTDERLSRIYRRLTEKNAAQVEAERLVALAQGAKDEAALREVARSAAAADALRVSLALQAEAELLAQAAASVDSTQRRVAHADRARHAVRANGTGRSRVARWAAVAAAVAFGFALMLKQSPLNRGAGEIAGLPAADDRILAGDFEGAPSAAEAKPDDDRVFVDDFGA